MDPLGSLYLFISFSLGSACQSAMTMAVTAATLLDYKARSHHGGTNHRPAISVSTVFSCIHHHQSSLSLTTVHNASVFRPSL